MLVSSNLVVLKLVNSSSNKVVPVAEEVGVGLRVTPIKGAGPDRPSRRIARVAGGLIHNNRGGLMTAGLLKQYVAIYLHVCGVCF